MKWSFSFVPSNTCQPERTYIFKNGFTVLDGPQTKIDRKDTCDAMLEEMASLFLESERCYDTFIIASHDGDFRRIKNKIENHNRKFILFHLGGANADLLENGTINEDLSEFIWEALGKIKPKPLDLEALAESEPHKGPDSKPHFSEVLRVLSQDGFPEKCLHSALLSAIVSTLLEKNYATGNPWDGKNFIVLKKLVWEDLSEKFSKYFTLDDCHAALSALADANILHSSNKNGNNQQRYYVLNRNDSRLARL